MLRTVNMLQTIWQPLRLTVRHTVYPSYYSSLFSDMPRTNYSCLEDGMRLATEYRLGSRHCCVGIFVDGGSRHEVPLETGIANLFTLIAFSNTKNSPRDKLRALMGTLGVRFRCFVTRQIMVLYAECLVENVDTVLNILGSCLYENTYDPEEIRRQKKVANAVLQAEDNNSNSVVFDYLHQTAFQGTPLAHSVVGSSKYVRRFTKNLVECYMQRIVTPDRVVVATSGGISHEVMKRMAKQYCCMRGKMCHHVQKPCRFTGSEVRYRDDSMLLCNIAIAFEGPPMDHGDQFALEVARMYLGGWDRSQSGDPDNTYYMASAYATTAVADAYRTFNIRYPDVSLWGVHFTARKEEIDMAIHCIQTDLMTLCSSITESQLDRAKDELKTSILWKRQSARKSCLELGQWTLYAGHRHTLENQMACIDAVNMENLRTICDKYFYDRCPVVAAVGPLETLPDYTRIRAGTHWLRM